MTTSTEVRAAVAELLRSCGMRAAGIYVSDLGTWRARGAHGTWTDDGEVFLDD